MDDLSVDSDKMSIPRRRTVKPYLSEGEILSQDELEFGELNDF